MGAKAISGRRGRVWMWLARPRIRTWNPLIQSQVLYR